MPHMNVPQIPSFVVYIVFVWSLFWKGLALWRSAKEGQRNWFIALLVLNTVGLLDIIYLFSFSKKKMKLSELKFWK